jgi:hypothetical protein
VIGLADVFLVLLPVGVFLNHIVEHDVSPYVLLAASE